MQNEITIAGRRIGAAHQPYIIAEMSANHNGRIENALRLIKAAKDAGADAIKLQTYTADTITLNCDSEDFQVRGGLWDGRTLYDLYQEAHLPWEWHAELFAYARAIGITIFSSPFDESAIDLLERLDAPAYKIASFEAIDLPLIAYAAKTGKPLIISTGMASEAEIQQAVHTARSAGCAQVAILRCVSGYPAPASEYNLRTIPDMMTRFGCVTGLSDHTLTNATAVAAIALGAALVEKHFTFSRSDGGPDGSFSLEPGELADLCRSTRTAWEAMGRVDYSCKPSEKGNLKFRRSLYFVKTLSAGDVITADAVRSVRPGFGLAPQHKERVVGMRAARPVSPGDRVTEDILA